MKDFEPAIRCSRVGYLKVPSLKFKSHRHLASIFSFMRFYDRERFVSVCFDKNKRIIGYEVVSIGGLSFSAVLPRDVLKMPLLTGARYLAFIHNHPSGDFSVSDDDVALTLRMALAAKIFSIKIICSIVLGGDGYSVIKVGYHKDKMSRIPSVKRFYYIDDWVKRKNGRMQVNRYEIFIKENFWYSSFLEERGFTSYKSIRRYLRDNNTIWLAGNDDRNGFVVMYVDDSWRLLYNGIYDLCSGPRIIKDVLLKGILLNAARFIVGVKRFRDNKLGWKSLRKVRHFSRMVGVPLEDLVILS